MLIGAAGEQALSAGTKDCLLRQYVGMLTIVFASVVLQTSKSSL